MSGDFWAFIFLMVLVSVISSAIVKIVKIKEASRASGQAAGSQSAALIERLDKLERRMANIETIVLESEKHREFERAL